MCENQKNVTEFCPSTAWVRSEDVIKGNGPIMTRLPHNHLPPNVDIPMVHLRQSIGLAGTSTGNLANSIRQIFNQEVVLNPEGAHNYTHLQPRSCLNKMRRRRCPVNPKTVDQLAYILNEPKAMPYVSTLQHPSSRFYQHNFQNDQNIAGQIILSQKLYFKIVNYYDEHEATKQEKNKY